MIADPAILALGLKMLATALIVIVAAIAAERAGPQLGGIIASLPVSAGPAYVFLAMKADDGFIATSALASLLANAVTAVFLLYLAFAAAHLSTILSFVTALAVWAATVSLLRLLPLEFPVVAAVNVATYGIAIAIVRRRRFAVPAGRAAGGWLDLLARALLVAGLVGTVVAVSERVGPALTGIAALFPMTFTSVGLLIHARLGGAACAAAMASGLVAMIGFTVGLALVHLTAVPIGTPPALVLALLCCLGWAGLLVWLRRRRQR